MGDLSYSSRLPQTTGPSHDTFWGTTYHQDVIKQEDFSLVQPELLGLLWVWNLEEPAVADQPLVGQREHLYGEEALRQPPAPPLQSLCAGNPALGLAFENAFSHQPHTADVSGLLATFPALPQEFS